MTPILVPIKTAAELCGVSRSTFFEWNRRGYIDFVRVGGQGRPMVRYADLETLAREAVPA